MRTLNIDIRDKTKSEIEKRSAKRSTATVKTSKEDTAKLAKEIEKLDIHKDEKEAEKVLKRAAKSTEKISKAKKSTVFKKLAELKNKKRGGIVLLKDLVAELKDEMEEKTIIAALDMLDDEHAITWEVNEGKIYM